ATLASSPSLPSLSLSASFQLEVNTTNIAQSVKGFTVDPSSGNITNNQTIAIGANTFLVAAGGQLPAPTLLNLPAPLATPLNLAGEFDLTVNSSGLDLNANATLTSFLGANLGLHAHLGLINADASGSGGLVINAGLSLNARLGIGIFSVSATPTLLVNTSNV